jgi:hypothetical protein
MGGMQECKAVRVAVETSLVDEGVVTRAQYLSLRHSVKAAARSVSEGACGAPPGPCCRMARPRLEGRA